MEKCHCETRFLLNDKSTCQHEVDHVSELCAGYLVGQSSRLVSTTIWIRVIHGLRISNKYSVAADKADRTIDNDHNTNRLRMSDGANR